MDKEVDLPTLDYKAEYSRLNKVINNMQCQIDALKKVIESLVYSQGIEDTRRSKL